VAESRKRLSTQRYSSGEETRREIFLGKKKNGGTRTKKLAQKLQRASTTPIQVRDKIYTWEVHRVPKVYGKEIVKKGV
jgi:hypothetical protein